VSQGSNGHETAQVSCRHAGISAVTYYAWISKYGLDASELRRVKDLESENSRLKRMYAELALDNAAMNAYIGMIEYNEESPHDSLVDLTPSEFRQKTT
jgi:putative transposase